MEVTTPAPATGGRGFGSGISGYDERLAARLAELAKDEQRAELAMLRRGLSSAGYLAAAPVVAPLVPGDATRWDEDSYYLVGALFGLHQGSAAPGANGRRQNLGDAFRQLQDAGAGAGGERRFLALLNADADELPTRLRHAISLLKAHEVLVDWAQLAADVRRWQHADRRVQRAWARRFWGADTSAPGAASGDTDAAPASAETDAPAGSLGDPAVG